jgi:potassium-dependent mechanosensitive channel
MRQYRVESWQRRLGVWLLVCSAAGFLGGADVASARDGTSDEANKTAPAAGAGTNAIPLAEVAAKAEETFGSLHSIEASLAADEVTPAIAAELAVLTRETATRQEESSKILSTTPSLESLRRLNGEWQALRDELTEWKGTLSKRIKQLDEERDTLAKLEQSWEATRASAPAVKMPPAMQEQVERVLAAVKRTQEKADAQQTGALTLETRIAQQDGQAIRELSTIERAREAFLRQLLVRDSQPIWSGQLWSEPAQSLGQQSYSSFSRQVQALKDYAIRKGGSFVLQAGLFLVILVILIWAGRQVRKLGGAEAGQAGVIFDVPIATALVLALLVSSWIYPEAPRLLWSITGAVALIPAVVLLRRLIDRRLFPVLDALVILYFVDQVRSVAAAQPLLSRILLMAETLGSALFIGWLLGPARLGAVWSSNRFWKASRLGCRIALLVFVVSFILNAVGYVRLGRLLGRALLQSSYMALTLYAVVRVFDGLFLSAMSIPPLVRLGVVQRHRQLLHSRAQVILGWTAVVLWVAYVLETVSLRAPVYQDLHKALDASLGAGAFKFTLGDIVWFGLTVWVAFIVSRTLRFVLEEEVYPRVHLAPGLHYSISRMVHYAILVIGFFIGVALLGFDLTKLTILVGAFGVGLGFGLQNIINNFVSGLILLFERPIKVGDVIQLGGNEGVVKHIGIRASIVRLGNGSEIIVPNGSLISDSVTNWTFSDRLRRIDIPLTVAGPAEVREVMELLNGLAAKHPQVNKEPPPQTLLTGFSGDSTSFELRCWTLQSEGSSQIRSELALAIRAALAERKITVK